MYRFVVSTVLILVPLLTNATVSGTFHTADHRILFAIQDRGTRLEVFDENYNDNSIYRLISDNTFRNNEGDMIKLRDQSKILFRPAHRNTIYTLHRHDQCSYNQNLNDSIGEREKKRNGISRKNQGNNENDGKNNTQYQNQSEILQNSDENWDDYKDKFFRYNGSLEGTWQSLNPRKTVVILLTRDGIKAKFSGTSNWVNYVKSDNQYIDQKGNKYEFEDDGRCRWIHSNGFERISLAKISNELKY